MTYACAIAPLDQSTTSLGWSPGSYVRYPCSLLTATSAGGCSWHDESLQFLANPGSPVVAPFPLVVTSLNPLTVRPAIELPRVFADATISINGITPAAVRGPLEKGGLLGRVAPGQRGVKWTLSTGPFIVPMLASLGLDIVGATRPAARGFRLTPVFGGRLLARAGGPADCTNPLSSLRGLRGLRGPRSMGARLLDLGSAAPTGYVEPPSGVYGRYGVSGQTDVSIPEPTNQNLARRASAAGGGLLALVSASVLAWLAMRR